MRPRSSAALLALAFLAAGECGAASFNSYIKAYAALFDFGGISRQAPYPAQPAGYVSLRFRPSLGFSPSESVSVSVEYDITAKAQDPYLAAAGAFPSAQAQAYRLTEDREWRCGDRAGQPARDDRGESEF